MKKSILIFLMILSLTLIFEPSPKIVYAKEGDGYDDLIKIINEELLKLDLSEIEEIIEQYDVELSSPTFKDYLLSIIEGDFKENSDDFFKYLITLLFSNVRNIFPNFISLIIIASLFKLMENFSTSINGVKTVVFYALSIAVIKNLYSIVSVCFSLTENLILNINGFISAVMPILLTLIIASGGEVSSTILKPGSVFLSGTLSQIISTIILPIVKIIILIDLVSSIVKNVNLTGISNLFNTLIKWIFGIGFTVFSVFITVQGIFSSNIDAITLKTMQYTVSNGVPIIGGYLSSGVSLVLAGTVLIKNAVGVGAIVILFSIVLSPLLYVIAVQILLKGYSAFIGLLCENKLSNTCTQLSKSISLLISVIAGVVFTLFLLLITALMTTGGVI